MKTYGMAFLIGIGLAFAKLVLGFFPLFNIDDIIVFGGAAYLFTQRKPGPWWGIALLLVIPSLILVARFLANLGTSSLQEGIGVGWFLSAVLIPTAALLGAYVGRRRSNAVKQLADVSGAGLTGR